MPLIDGTCSRSSAIAVRLAMFRALQTQSSGADPDAVDDVAKGVSRLEEVRVALTLSLLTGGMVVTVLALKAVLQA